jgi:Fe2+ or Zn2+ uptake regulation protein
MVTYFNTNKEAGEALRDSQEKAKRQEELVMSFFLEHPGEAFTACEVWQILFQRRGVPLTSVRRAMTVLMQRDKLEKLDFKQVGIYGKMVHLWRVAW